MAGETLGIGLATIFGGGAGALIGLWNYVWEERYLDRAEQLLSYRWSEVTEELSYILDTVVEDADFDQAGPPGEEGEDLRVVDEIMNAVEQEHRTPLEDLESALKDYDEPMDLYEAFRGYRRRAFYTALLLAGFGIVFAFLGYWGKSWSSSGVQAVFWIGLYVVAYLVYVVIKMFRKKNTLDEMWKEYKLP